MLIPIDGDYLSKLPIVAASHIESALRHSQGEEDLWEILNKINDNIYQLWVSIDTASETIRCTIVTSVVNYSKKKTCRIMYLGAETGFQEYLYELEGIEDFARAEGCNDIEVFGRPAWKRVLRQEGYEPTYTIMGKRL